MTRRKKRQFTNEFKANTVRLVQQSGKTVSEIARELDLCDSVLRGWMRQAEVDAGKGPKGALTTAERQELVQLRRDVKRLKMERDILKKAATFFAKESE